MVRDGVVATHRVAQRLVVEDVAANDDHAGDAFEVLVVAGREVVVDGDAGAGGQQFPNEVRTDETCATGHEDAGVTQFHEGER